MPEQDTTAQASNIIKISIPGFTGGLARSLYEDQSLQSFQTARNLDVYRSDKILTPLVRLGAQETSPAMSSAKIEWCFPASNGKVYFIGNSASSNALRVWATSGVHNTPGTLVLATIAGGDGGTNTAPDFLPDLAVAARWYHHCAELAGCLIFWCGLNLARVTLATDTLAADPFSFAAGVADVYGPIFTHDGLKKMYIGSANNLYMLSSTTISGSADPELVLTLDPKYRIRSLDSFGRFLLIGAQQKNDIGTSKVFVYDGSAITVEDTIDIGDIGLQSVRNVNGVVHILATHVVYGEPQGYMRVYLWQGGGTVTLADEILITPATDMVIPGQSTQTMIDDASVAVSGDRIFWGFRGFDNTSSGGFLNITNGIYCFGSSAPGKPRIDTLHLTPSAVADAYSISAIRIIRGNIVVLYNNQAIWHMDSNASNPSPGYKASGGIYQSNAIRLNHDGTGKGKILKIKLQHEPLPASCGFTVKVRTFGEYPEGTTPPAAAFVTIGSVSTEGASFTNFDNIANFVGPAEYAQIEIDYDTVSGSDAPGIIFPIELEVERV